MPENSDVKNEVTAACLGCTAPFIPARSNQRYCTPKCQKATTRNTARGPRNVTNSSTERTRARYHNARAKELAVALYSLPPFERLGFMHDLIEAARDHDAHLRGILTDPRLLSAPPEKAHLFFRRCPASYRTIAQAADAYCRRFWGYGAPDVVHSRCPEPETGEVLHASVAA